MKSFAFVLAMGAVNALNTAEFEYMNYIAKFNKQLADSTEFDSRLGVFMKADAFIKAHNSRPSNYVLGHNKFSDWHSHEIEA